tara:strand:- start:2107 stop:4404 length:2298 start_codon:yes stop_codon:yes gene_type:complete
MATKIQLRRDTAADWTSANPTLAAGEFGYESDTTKFKIGDGSTAWNSLAYKTGEGIKVVADDSATITVAEAGTLYVQGGSNVTTSTDSAGVLTINATGEVTGSSTTTFTNKTFDAEGTGNALSNVDVANLKSGVLDTDLSSVSGSDDTLASAKAIKTYVDANAGGGASTGDITFTGSTINSPSNADITLNPGGTGGVEFPSISINDNKISSNRSNDSIHIEANGTGQVELGVPFDGIRTNTRYDYGVNKAYVNSSYDGATRIIANSEGLRATATQTTSSSNFQLMAENRTALEMAGFSFTSSNETRGLRAKNYNCVVGNDDSSSAATIGVVNPITANASLFTSNGNITATNVKNYRATLEGEPTSGKTATFTTSYNYWGKGPVDVGEGGTTQATNYYGVYIDTGSVATNNYGVWINNDAYINKLGGVTLQNGDVTTGAITLADNKIKANRSNDSICIQGNGTGQVLLAANGGDYDNISTNSRYDNANIMIYSDLAHTAGSGNRTYKNVMAQDIQLTAGQNSSNSNDRFRNQAICNLQLNGSSMTATSGQYRSRGPVGLEAYSIIRNDSSTNATLGQASGGNYGISIYPGSSGDLAISNVTAMGTYVEISHADGDITIGDAVAYESIGLDTYDNGSGSTTVTDFYAFRAGAHSIQTDVTLTNDYAFFTESATALSQFAAVRLLNQSGDPTGVANTSHIYAKDDSSSSEVFVRDEAGNVTKISPHNEAGEWEYYSVNKNTGKKVRVNMERMIKKLEQLTGETFIESE